MIGVFKKPFKSFGPFNCKINQEKNGKKFIIEEERDFLLKNKYKNPQNPKR